VNAVLADLPPDMTMRSPILHALLVTLLAVYEGGHDAASAAIDEGLAQVSLVEGQENRFTVGMPLLLPPCSTPPARRRGRAADGEASAEWRPCNRARQNRKCPC